METFAKSIKFFDSKARSIDPGCLSSLTDTTSALPLIPSNILIVEDDPSEEGAGFLIDLEHGKILDDFAPLPSPCKTQRECLRLMDWYDDDPDVKISFEQTEDLLSRYQDRHTASLHIEMAHIRGLSAIRKDFITPKQQYFNVGNTVAASKSRTGTKAFMSGELLSQHPYAHSTHNRPGCGAHDVLHDVESFFWVLVYLVITREGHGGHRRPELLTSTPSVEEETIQNVTYCLFDAADELTLCDNKNELFLQPEDFKIHILPMLNPRLESKDVLAELVENWWKLLVLTYLTYDLYTPGVIHDQVLALLRTVIDKIAAVPGGCGPRYPQTETTTWESSPSKRVNDSPAKPATSEPRREESPSPARKRTKMGQSSSPSLMGAAISERSVVDRTYICATYTAVSGGCGVSLSMKLKTGRTPPGRLRYELFHTKWPGDVLQITAVVDVGRLRQDRCEPVVLRVIGERITFDTIMLSDGEPPRCHVVSNSCPIICYERVLWDAYRDADESRQQPEITGIHHRLELLIPLHAPFTSPPSTDPHASIVRYYLELECAWSHRALFRFFRPRHHLERHPVTVVPRCRPLSAPDAASQRSPPGTPPLWRAYTLSRNIQTRSSHWGKCAHVEVRLPDVPALPMEVDIPLMLCMTMRSTFVDVRRILDGGAGLLQKLPGPPRDAYAVTIQLVRAVSVCFAGHRKLIPMPTRKDDVQCTVYPLSLHVNEPVWEPLALPCDSSIRGMRALWPWMQDAERAGAGAKRGVRSAQFAARLRLSVPVGALTRRRPHESASYFLYVHIPLSGFERGVKVYVPVKLASH
ncbi:hypothetical protein PUNSTDRAFT_141819 [Punctularia strigosozonata HHB-11173 SS5]|uniref:uncharacterized protein n=1 Tax=Punctularia strigosozonata (strain HHB-11173) TaxID=741275 RepID=UPI0004416921|nr:uncharacterized protein PUNSTDRAFT_141819 [Punctularia strigosozonata HHB-11173 SS5]EIN11456.1 hypothetical protein PUNSTDRAFT_141819 [Punctularia strigosozonata HHB-11173 SS5]